MRLGPILLPALLAATPALALTALERIEPRLAVAIKEHRVFLTCAAADQPMFNAIRANWNAMLREARKSLDANGTPAADLDGFDARTAIEAVALPSGTPADTIAAFCAAENAGWSDRYRDLQFVYKIDETPLP